MARHSFNVRDIVTPEDLELAYKIELDFNVPPYPYDMFVGKVSSTKPKTYLVGCYSSKNKLVGYCLYANKNNYLADILRLGIQYGQDPFKVAKAILDALPEKDVQMKVRAKQVGLCDILLDNKFELDEQIVDKYTDPVDDMYIFSRGAQNV